MKNQNQDIRGENLKTDNLRSEILRDITNSNLTIGVIYYIFKDLTRELENLYNQQVDAEYKEFCELANKDAAAAQGSESETEEETPAAAEEKKEEN